MKTIFVSAAILGASLTAVSLTREASAAEKQEAGFESIFDGQTLKGWHASAQTGHSRASGNKSRMLVSLPAVGADPGPKTPLSPLFDGKSFAGWEGNLQAFRIQDGAIVSGQLDKPVPRNEYLCTINVYRDFELRLKSRLRGENVNAGVQFRSERVPGSNEMIGYQADMGQHYWGCLYDERRHKLLAGPTKEEQQKLIRHEDWNDYVIRAEGRHVQLWLNGQKKPRKKRKKATDGGSDAGRPAEPSAHDAARREARGPKTHVAHLNALSGF